MALKKKIRFSREIGGPSIDDMIADGIEAERLGFDYLWVPDHLVDIQPVFAIYDAWTVLAFLSAKTEKIKLCSGVTDIQRMHPSKTANIVCTLDNLTKGRAVLGIGAGEIMNTKPYGISWEEKDARIGRLREFLILIKSLWSSSYDKPANYGGKYYSLHDAHLSLPPLQTRGPPIYIGAFSSKAMLRLVGEIADGWYPGSINTLEAFKEKVEVIREASKQANRSIDSIDIIAAIPTFVCSDKVNVHQVRQEIKSSLKREMVSNQYLFKALGLKKEEFAGPNFKDLGYQFAYPGKRYDKALEEAVSKLAIPDEVLEKGVDTMMAVGSANECIMSIKRFIEGGATHIFFSNLAGNRENYQRIGKEIMASFVQE